MTPAEVFADDRRNSVGPLALLVWLAATVLKDGTDAPIGTEDVRAIARPNQPVSPSAAISRTETK